MRHYDMLVIGSGPAGHSAAIQAAELGKKVVIIEKKAAIGGVSLHTGTIPSKTLREAVMYLTGYNQRGLYGQSYRLKATVSVEDLMKRLDITVNHEVQVMETQLYRSGVRVIQGAATFEDTNTVMVTGPKGDVHRYSADKIVLATGTKPYRPAHIPFDGTRILDSDDILTIKHLPRRMIVVGAGVIGTEYASLFSALDVNVTLIDGRDTMLDFLDKEVVEECMHFLRKRNVRIRLGEKVVDVEHAGQKQILTTLESGKKIHADMILFASGRVGNVKTLQVDKVGLKPDDRGRLTVNRHYQTNIPNIYACGDLIGFPSLASSAMEQGRLSASHAFGQPRNSHAETFPFAIYGIPEISMVGMTEQELTKKKIPYTVGIARIAETARGQIMGARLGFLKLLFDQDGKLMGVHILGEESSELIHVGQAVMAHNGSIDYFLENIFNYPTLSEAYKVAALDAWNQMEAQRMCPIDLDEDEDIEVEGVDAGLIVSLDVVEED
ncbi:Si-specific NAD(P)(+) transhydrogenase [Magnetococcus sp. PR-3]|uniref:Si-specific NAD(P)(+) transhydrogenase n=1 Tax=Magnetococcus sp. PR-3 TaxID=3120355 RepID=UPI002FCE3F64